MPCPKSEVRSPKDCTDLFTFVKRLRTDFITIECGNVKPGVFIISQHLVHENALAVITRF